MPRVKRQESEEDTEKKDAYDIIADGIQKHCEIPGCRAKFHGEEARYIVAALQNAGLLREGN